MKKSDILSMPDYFYTYINLVEDGELNLCLNKYLHEISKINIKELEALGDQVYAPNKWTVKDIIQHVIDTERILCYRALRFARNDRNELPGFEENSFAENTTANNRSIKDMLDEFAIVRKGSIALFNNFNDEMLNRSGKASGREISVLALGFVLTGHQIHHFNIIKERYLPLLQQTVE